jgi:hypothetical protein
VDDGVRCRANDWSYCKPGNKVRQRDGCYIRGAECNRVRKMAYAAVLVFVRLAVPVSRGLHAEGQHGHSHQNGQ